MGDAKTGRLIKTALYSILAVLVGIMGALIIQGNIAHVKVQDKGMRAETVPVAGIPIGGPFELIDHNGNTVTEADYADTHKLLYFGFTYCPAICPTELQKMSKVLEILGGKSEEIQPIFVSVDPERDTPEVMKDYVSLFHPDLIGLTGSQKQIEDVMKTYRIFARKVQTEEMTDYTVDHSSYIYFMSPDDKLLGIYRIKDSAEAVAQDIQRHL